MNEPQIKESSFQPFRGFDFTLEFGSTGDKEIDLRLGLGVTKCEFSRSRLLVRFVDYTDVPSYRIFERIKGRELPINLIQMDRHGGEGKRYEMVGEVDEASLILDYSDGGPAFWSVSFRLVR